MKYSIFNFSAFSSDKVQGRIFWASQVMDIPFLGMNPDACLSTSCPIEAGLRNTYHVEIPILKKYPVVSIGNNCILYDDLIFFNHFLNEFIIFMNLDIERIHKFLL